jgi:hypothetical protein
MGEILKVTEGAGRSVYDIRGFEQRLRGSQQL